MQSSQKVELETAHCLNNQLTLSKSFTTNSVNNFPYNKLTLYVKLTRQLPFHKSKKVLNMFNSVALSLLVFTCQLPKAKNRSYIYCAL